MKQRKYIYLPAVPGGYAYHDVNDKSGQYPNFTVACFSDKLPCAGLLARTICFLLNLFA